MASSLQLNYIKKFSGYFNYRDITNLLPNALTVGSQNMFILDGVKVATRGGMSYLGAPGTVGSVTNASWTLPNRIHSHYDTFENNQGMVMPFRVWYSGSSAQGDVAEAWLPTYLAGVPQATKKWYQVNANTPSNPILSNHKWYWGEWFDSVNNINRIVASYGQQTVTSYTGGYAPIVNIIGNTLQTVPGTAWEEFGFVEPPEGVTKIVINVSGVPTELTITGTQTALFYSNLTGTFLVGETVTGGTSGATGIVLQVIGSGELIFSSVIGTFLVGETVTGGTSFATAKVVTSNLAPFSTDTVTVASTTGIVADDLAFQVFNNDTVIVQSTDTGLVADQSLSLGNQIYYFDWRQRNVLLSWEFNQTAFNTLPVYQGSSGLNDAIFTGTYTGTQTDTFQVSIDSAATNYQTFTSGGSNNLNDSQFYTQGYTGTSGTTNVYTMQVIADTTIAVTGTSAITLGQTVVGNTSGAVGVVAGKLTITGNDSFGIQLLTPSVPFQVGETLLSNSGTTSGAITQVLNVGWFQLLKNGVIVPLTIDLGTPTPANVIENGFIIDATHGMPDGLAFQWGAIYGHQVGDSFTLTISGLYDTFSWALNGVNQASKVPVSLTPTLLSNGVSVNFNQVTSHNIGDNWLVVFYPTITRGWRQTYYTGYGNTAGTTPATNKGSIRLPGEGFKMQLDSNSFAAQVQEDVMYVNGAGGEYYTIQPQLSSNNQTQTYTVTRLKTAPQKKAIYPYQMVAEPNYLAIVTTEKTWDVLGRQKFIELPQLKTFSDFVKYDFLNANWLNSEQTYFDRKQWFILPEQNQVFCYDDFMKYWHPPQSFGRRIGSLCIIDGQVCAHSYERNETYQVFTTDMNDLDEFAINTNITISYYDLNKRYNEKTVQAIAFDGYMQGAPEITWTVNGGVGGCDFQQTGTINPSYCLPEDTASLGKSQYGYHGLGNSPETVIPHFTYGETFTEQNYYLRNISLTCNSFEQLWSITSIAELTKYDLTTNSKIFNKDSKG